MALTSPDATSAHGTPGFGEPARKLGFQPSLEGVRGLAVLLVLAVHLGEFVVPRTQSWFVPGGFIGVDIFFVLSGYLIGAILIGEVDSTGVIRAGRFYWRRFVRLVPALLLLLATHFLYVAWSEHTSLAHERSIDITAVLFVSNWRNSIGIGRISDMVHLWSVAAEMQWYIVAPIIVFVLDRYVRKTSRIVAVLVGAMVAIAVLRSWEYHRWHDFSMVHERTDARFDTFLAGLIVAFLWRRGALRAGAVRVAGTVGLLAIAIVSFTAHANGPNPSPWLSEWGSTLVAAAAAGVVAVCLLPHSGIGALFRWTPLRATGRISYSLYLWHLPVFYWVATHVHASAVVEMALAVALSYAFATTAFFVAEYPVLRHRPSALKRSDRYRAGAQRATTDAGARTNQGSDDPSRSK